MRRYSAYKDSDIEWVGEIPDRWSTKPLFALLKERQVPNEGNTETNVLSLSYGRIIRRDVESNFGLLPESFETYNIVEPLDIVLRLTDLQNDKRSLRCGLVQEKGIITSAYLALQKKAEIDPKYMYYLLHNYDIWKVFYSMGGGVRQAIKFNDLKRLPILLPSFDEQKAIVAYLDHKTSKISELITKKERMIEIIKENIDAIINLTVTKGLDSRTEMKESGVKTIGMIPKHWKICAIKRIVEIPITDGPHETPELLEDGIPFISAEAIKNDQIDFSKKRGFISAKEHKRFLLKYKPKRDDIYMVKSGATTGNIAIVETDEEFNIWSPLAVIRPSQKKVLTRYAFYFMKSKSFFSSVEIAWSFGTQQNIGMGVIGNLPITIPPINEQKKIVEFLGPKISQIQAQVEREKKSIGLLKEYRTSLISEVVTGKIDVRSGGELKHGG